LEEKMAQFQFVMRSGPTPGRTFPLEGDQLTIGRESSNALAINDAEISRKHSRLTFQGGKYVLEDLGSTNGTFVNGQRLAGPVVLKPGDVVSLGEHIVLMYDAINVDPGATVAAPRRAVHVPPPPPIQSATPVETVHTPPPQHVEARATTIFGGRNTTPIFIGVAVFLCLCSCAAFFWWIDATFRWCVFFPFISGCP
jgi:predicted component of type VI protein secretion system